MSHPKHSQYTIIYHFHYLVNMSTNSDNYAIIPYMIQDILKNIGISDTASRIYLHLLENGVSSARQIAENLNMPRPSVYDNLKVLITSGLVAEQDKENKKLFQIDDVNNISHLIKEQMDNLEKQGKDLKEILPNLAKQQDFLEPKIRSYGGADGLRHAMNDILWYDHIETSCVWPMSEMIKVLGADYLNEFNKKRIRRKISLKVIWPQDKLVDFKEFQFLGVGEEFLRDLRLGPKGMTWNMGFLLYADKVIFVSSRKESFGFVVHSRDFAGLMKSQFEMIWPLCEIVKPNPKDTAPFLETI